MSMLAVVPIAINNTNLDSSTISEPDTSETVWTAGSYSVGDERISTTTHFVYRSLVNSNTLNPESDTYDKLAVGGIGNNWAIISYTNKYRMFDNVIGSQSTGDDVVVEVTPSALFNSVAGLNVTGATAVNIAVDDPTDGEVYNHDVSMIDNSAIVDYYEYYFYPIVNLTEFSFFNLPPYPNATMTVTFTGTGVGIGELLTGSQINIGTLQRGASWEPMFFGRRERDEFGNFIIDDRGSADIFSYPVKIMKSRASYVRQQLKSLGNTPTLFADPEVDGTLSYGYYESINLNFATPSLYDMTLNVQGLI